jgi:NADH-quinone oxidoreductase subunit L
MGIIVALTLLVIVAAYFKYVRKQAVPVDDAALTGLQRTLYHKYYIDEVYDAVIVKPLYFMARVFDSIIDKVAIDGIVNSVGYGIVAGSKVFRLLQNGRIGYYIFMMVVSIMIILALATLGSN